MKTIAKHSLMQNMSCFYSDRKVTEIVTVEPTKQHGFPKDTTTPV